MALTSYCQKSNLPCRVVRTLRLSMVAAFCAVFPSAIGFNAVAGLVSFRADCSASVLR